MAQLVERAARDHAADDREGAVRADTARLLRETQPHAAAALDLARQGAVVDLLVPDAGDPADSG